MNTKKVKKVSLIHQNAQSMGNSVDLIKSLVQQHSECMFICITEHWQSKQQLASLGIGDYQLVSQFCRNENQHGGAAIYCQKEINYKVCKKICKYSVKYEFEVAAAEFVVNKMQIIVITIYRPSGGSLPLFFDRFEQMLTDTFLEDKIYFIVGDFNIEMKDDNNDKTCFTTLLNSFNIYQTIFEYTRITHNSKSCIDNIFTNYQDDYRACTLNTCISDHTAQKITFNIEDQKNNIIYKRFFDSAARKMFVSQLQQQTWDDVYKLDSSDVDSQWNCFIGTFINIFNENFPVRLVKLGRKKCNVLKNSEIDECKRQLDILLVMSQHDKNYKEAYKFRKKQYDDLLRKAQSQLYESKIEHSDNKSKCVWGICKQITGTSIKNRDCHIKGEEKMVADNYNRFLLNAVPELLKNIDDIPLYGNIEENNKSMFVTPVTSAEVVGIINKLKSKYSCGCDEIPTSVIKICASEVSITLSYIIDNSFTYGIFPKQLKLAHVIPVFKKGDPELMENYRPISLLPGFSKIFEKAMCNRLINFMERYEIFNDFQHGYLKGRSTQTAVFQYIKDTLDQLENKNLALGIFLDLSKAYDCINHNYLLLKLEKYGVRGNALDWFRSYLSDRQQRVLVQKNNQNIKSDILENRLGVPQGSIAGPVLFIIYVNDLCLSIKTNPNCKIASYADDTSLLIGAGLFSDLITRSTEMFSDVCKWFMANKLILNKEKTNLILFHTKQNRIEVPKQITLGNINLQRINRTKFLGLQIEETLDWTEHISSLCSKLNQICYSLRIVGRYVSRETLAIIYYANFESVLKYGIIFWGSNASTYHVFTIQKKVIRIMNGMKYHDTCRGVFKANSMMTVYGIYVYECLMFIYNNKSKFLTNNFDHQYNTRTTDINYPLHRLTLTEKSPHYMCIKFFNKLPVDIRIIESYNRYKQRIRELLINLEPYSCEEYLCEKL